MVTISRANPDNVDEILFLQKLAYRPEAELYSDLSIAPLVQDRLAVLQELESGTILKAVFEKHIIGSVRAILKADTCFIGKLIVDPAHQDKGLGKELMKNTEEIHRQANRYELFTGHKSLKNLALYQKLGYSIFKSQPVTDQLTLIFMEKYNN
jgi:GNAT superfamily N-acetyltransferase